MPAADAVPHLIDADENRDGHYTLTPFYEAMPGRDEETLPVNVTETLARIHAYNLDQPLPPDLPVVDGDWWRAKCDVSAQRLGLLDRPVAHELQDQVNAFRNEPKIINALDHMPRTLIHGDVHRNNVLVDNTGQGHIIEWGGAFIGAPTLDLPNLGGPNSPGHRTYTTAWHQLTGQLLDNDPDWHHSLLIATVWVNIKSSPSRPGSSATPRANRR